MFGKILIANRGEIACRIIRTARRMGIATVAVHSEADAGALHVGMADEAVAIGAAPSSESYLVAGRIIAAAQAAGAEAIHPGFGFLSENADFARAAEAAGIVFIGPGADAIAAMGDKIESKRLAAGAGVPVVPGHVGEIADVETAIGIARGIGYPVMIKASAGGGGKGMRAVRDDRAMREVFDSTVGEAVGAFGDGRVFIEKFIPDPRHIEIQVLADAHGNVIHLGERECSIQRRHQKVVEECPSPFLDAATREAMGAQAVALARAVGYRSAGTVEFVVDGGRNFHFLEMNTRLQVEHPVTEMTTGIDLVEQMLRIAAGEPLGLRQADVRLDGWAIEVRLYAENPERNFAPSVGRLSTYRPPEGEEGVRIDTGVVEGSEISMFYDPMIAKLAAHGADREEARTRLAAALDRFPVGGVDHNVDFLTAVLVHPRFAEGRLSTAFLEQEFPEGYRPEAGVGEHRALFAAVAVRMHCRNADGPRRDWTALVGADAVAVRLSADGSRMEVDGRTHTLEDDWRPGLPVYVGRFDGRAVAVRVAREGIGWNLSRGGARILVRVMTPRTARLLGLMPEKAPPDMSDYLLSPMPGLLTALHVSVGDEVEAGQALAVVEAMKMENVLRAQREGTVAEIPVSVGDSLVADQVILAFGRCAASAGTS